MTPRTRQIVRKSGKGMLGALFLISFLPEIQAGCMMDASVRSDPLRRLVAGLFLTCVAWGAGRALAQLLLDNPDRKLWGQIPLTRRVLLLRGVRFGWPGGALLLLAPLLVPLVMLASTGWEVQAAEALGASLSLTLVGLAGLLVPLAEELGGTRWYAVFPPRHALAALGRGFSKAPAAWIALVFLGLAIMPVIRVSGILEPALSAAGKAGRQLQAAGLPVQFLVLYALPGLGSVVLPRGGSGWMFAGNLVLLGIPVVLAVRHIVASWHMPLELAVGAESVGRTGGVRLAQPDPPGSMRSRPSLREGLSPEDAMAGRPVFPMPPQTGWRRLIALPFRFAHQSTWLLFVSAAAVREWGAPGEGGWLMLVFVTVVLQTAGMVSALLEAATSSLPVPLRWAGLARVLWRRNWRALVVGDAILALLGIAVLHSPWGLLTPLAVWALRAICLAAVVPMDQSGPYRPGEVSWLGAWFLLVLIVAGVGTVASAKEFAGNVTPDAWFALLLLPALCILPAVGPVAAWCLYRRGDCVLFLPRLSHFERPLQDSESLPTPSSPNQA